jgi:uncharacterized protein YaeQ
MTEIGREAAMAELYRRNAMTPEQKAAYEELMRRGVVTLDRSMGERAADNLSQGFRTSAAGFTQRQFGDSNANGFDLGDIWGHDDNNNGWDFSDLGPKIRPGTPLDRGLDLLFGDDRGYARTTDGLSAASARERERLRSYEARATADPVRNVGDAASSLAGLLGGSAVSPESWVGPAAGGLRGLAGRELAGAITGRAVVNAGVGGATDALLQGGNIASGVQDRFSLAQTLGSAAIGGALSVGGDGFVRPLAERVRRAFTDPVIEPAPVIQPAATDTSGAALTAAATPAQPVTLPDFADVRPVERGLLANVRRSIGEKGIPQAAADIGSTIWGEMQARTARLYTSAVDEMHPIVRLRDRMMGEIEGRTGNPVDLRPSQDPMKLARGKHDVFNIGQMDILHGVHDYGTAKANGPALADIVTAAGVRFTRAGKTVADAIDELGKYAAARRAVAEWKRHERGELEADPVRTSRGDLEAYIARMDTEQPEFRDLSDGLNDYAQGLLKKRLDSGRLDRKTYETALAARDFYTPLRRIMDTEAAPGVSGGKNKGPAVKKFKGSERDIENPIVALMEETFRLAQQTRVNDLNLSMVNLAERLNRLTGEGEANPFIRKIKTPMSKVTVKAEDLPGPNALDDLDVWRPGEINDAGKAVIYVWRNGKREAWEMVDPEWGAMAFEAMSNMTRAQSDLWVEVVGAGTRFLSRTITRDPSFLVANFVRDAMSSWTLTRDVKPGEGLMGVWDELTQADSSRLYNLSGGISGGEASSNVNSMLKTRDVTEMARRFKWDQGAIKMRYAADLKGVLRLGADAYRATELTETGSRRQVFKNAFKRAQKEGLNEYDAMLEAAFTARDYADFGRHGSKMYAARRIVTFLNPWVQGLDKLVRTSITDPASAIGRAHAAGGREAALKAILKPLFRQSLDDVPLRKADKDALKLAVHAWTRMSAMGVFGLGLSAILRDDPDYREASERNRSTHWIIPVGEGNLLRIPKPFEAAFMSNILERGFEATYGDDPTAWNRMWSGLVELFAPPSDVPILNVATGWVTGVDPGTGRTIIPAGTEDLPPDLQFEWWTSSIAHDLGRDLGVAPAKVDFVLKTMGGPFGAYAMKMSDATDPDRPAGSWIDLPVARRFLSPSFRGSQDKRDFFDRAGARTSELNRALEGIRQDEEQGQLRRAQERFDALDDAGRIYVTSQRGEAPTDRLNPLVRARSVGRQVGRMIGELHGGEPPDTGDALPQMTAQHRQMVIDQLEKLAVAEMGNAMIATDQPGFAQRNMRDRNALWVELELMAPEVAREFSARLTRGSDQAYDYDAVHELWPQVRDRIRTEGVNADLDGFARQAKRRSPRRQRAQTDDESINAILFRLSDDD